MTAHSRRQGLQPRARGDREADGRTSARGADDAHASRADRERVRGDVLRMLREDIEPHTKLDEQLLYPAAAERLGDPLVAASMNYDHLAIREWIGDIGDTDIDDIPYLQGLLYGLDALIRVHVWKEDALFLGPLQRPSWPVIALPNGSATA